MIAQSKGAKCLVPGCDRIGVIRGLCQGCYQTAKRLVDTRRAAWDELVDYGLALPSKTRGISPLCEALERARQSQPAAAKKTAGAKKRK